MFNIDDPIKSIKIDSSRTDPRKSLNDDLMLVSARHSPVKREIERSRLNGFDDFMAAARNDVYSRIVEYSNSRRKKQID